MLDWKNKGPFGGSVAEDRGIKYVVDEASPGSWFLDVYGPNGLIVSKAYATPLAARRAAEGMAQ